MTSGCSWGLLCLELPPRCFRIESGAGMASVERGCLVLLQGKGMQCQSANVEACFQSLTYPRSLHQCRKGCYWVGPWLHLPHSPPWRRRWEPGKPVMMLLQTMVFLCIISKWRLWLFLGAPFWITIYHKLLKWWLKNSAIRLALAFTSNK